MRPRRRERMLVAASDPTNRGLHMSRSTSTTRRTATAVAAAVALALGAAAPATAQTFAASECKREVTASAYDVRLCGVPDVDQFRNGLPNDGGSYCVPTSLFNVLHYHANVTKVPMAFELAGLNPFTQYDKTTSALAWTSIMAGGDPASGQATYSGSQAAFDNVTSYAKSHGWTFARDFHYASGGEDFGYELAKRLARGPMQLSYKRWSQVQDGIWNTSGSGHSTTVVAAKGTAGGNEFKLLLADPGRAPDHGEGGYLRNQSAYTYEEVTVRRVQVTSREMKQITSGGQTYAVPVYVKSTQWELTGPSYETWQLGGTQRIMVYGFNWFEANKPV
jgi:hypothetical protein